MHSLIQELRQALRGLLKRPALFAVSVLSLGLGVGMSIVFFGVLDALLFRPPVGVRSPQEIVRLYYSPPGAETASALTSFPVHSALRQQVSELEGLAAHGSKMVALGQGAAAREVRAEFVTPNYFDVLGIRPVYGRFFGELDADGSSQAVVISSSVWQSSFGSSAAITGTTIQVNGRVWTIAGVAPPGFTGIDRTKIELWFPVATAERLFPLSLSPTSYWLSAFVRAAASPDSAVADHASAVATTLLRSVADHLETRVAFGPIVAERGPGETRSNEVNLIAWTSLAAAMLLLIACANIANLMLARFVAISRELTTRAFLGASRTRLVRCVSLEFGILTACGGTLATVVVVVLGGAARGHLVPGVELSNGSLDARTLPLIWSASVVCGFLCALPSLAYVTSRHSRGVTRDMFGNSQSRLQRRVAGFLVLAQCAISFTLLVGAGLFGRSFANIAELDLGIDVDKIVYAGASPNRTMRRTELLDLYGRFAERVRQIDGVERTSVAMGLPFRTLGAVTVKLPPEVRRGKTPVVLNHEVDAEYFQTIGLRLLRGRFFTRQDQVQQARVAVITDDFAKAYWFASDALGACLVLGDDKECTNVIGVAVNTPRWSITAEREYEVYLPLLSDGFAPKATIGLAIRTTSDPEPLVGRIRSAMQSVEADVAYATVTPLNATISPQIRPWRTATALFSAFGLLALVLAGIGLYGMLAFAVAREKREIGIRMALGTTPQRERLRVVRRGVLLSMIGTAAGVAVTGALAPIAESILFGVSARDPLFYCLGAGVVMLTAAGVSYVPATRAARVQCADLLRSE